MVRALIRRVLGRQENDQSTPQLELPPTDSRDRARSMVVGLQGEDWAGVAARGGEGGLQAGSECWPGGGGGRVPADGTRSGGGGHGKRPGGGRP